MMQKNQKRGLPSLGYWRPPDKKIQMGAPAQIVNRHEQFPIVCPPLESWINWVKHVFEA